MYWISGDFYQMWVMGWVELPQNGGFGSSRGGMCGGFGRGVAGFVRWVGFLRPKKGKDFGGEEYSEEFGECDIFEKKIIKKMFN